MEIKGSINGADISDNIDTANFYGSVNNCDFHGIIKQANFHTSCNNCNFPKLEMHAKKNQGSSLNDIVNNGIVSNYSGGCSVSTSGGVSSITVQGIKIIVHSGKVFVNDKMVWEIE